MSDGVMTYEDWLRGCVHHDGRHGYVTLPCDEVLKIADFIERLRADRKTENSSEKPNNCEDEPKTSCKTCRFGEVDEGYVRCAYYSKATEQDEPQTDYSDYERAVEQMEHDMRYEPTYNAEDGSM